MLECVPCTQEHLDNIKPRVREQDIEEYVLLTGRPANTILDYALNGETFAWIEDGVVLCIFGVDVHPDDPTVGVPWLIATDEGVSVGKRLVRHCKTKVEELGRGYKVMTNIVHSENLVAIRWLVWSGFTLLDPLPVGPFGSTFFPFVRYS